MFLKKFFGDKAFYKMTLSVAFPIMLQNIITNFVSLLDNIMVGALGTEQMSGVSIVNQLIFVFNLALFGALSGAGIFTAQFYGKNDNAHFDEDAVIVLDAGHGGTDGGAVSEDGLIEREINLEITQRLALMMTFCAQRVVLTRTDSNSLASPDAATIKEEKRSDLANRVTLVNSLSNTTLISIHQNYFPEGKYRGAQVFYASTPESEVLAKTLQEAFSQVLDCVSFQFPSP